MYKVADRVLETTTTTGLGSITLGGAKANFRSFSQAVSDGDLVDGDTVYYCIVHTNVAWEVGYGVYSVGTNTITRNLLASSTNAAIDLAAGTKDVFCTLPEDAFIALETSLDGRIGKIGFPVDSSGNYLTTLTYNETTRTVTITPTAASFDVYVGGIKYTKTGVQSIVHGTTQGGHFIYYDATGTLVTGTTPWDLQFHAPVAYVFWDATNSRAIPFEERHHAGRDVYWHRNQHAAEGTKATSGFGISGYTLNSGTADTAVTFAIASGRVEDEDIQVDTQVLPDNGPYTIMERVGAAGDWQITRTFTLPFFHAANVLQYNQFTGAVWQRTNVTEDNFVNYYVFSATALPTTDITPAPTTTQQIVIIPGQAIYSTEALAHAESIGNLSYGNIPFQEIVPLYQITIRYNAAGGGSFSNTARCAFTRVLRVIGTSASVTQSTQVDHGSLAGLSDLDHPASAIINTPAGTISATTVQAAIDELDSEKASKTGVETLTNKTLTTPIITGQTAPAFTEGMLWYDTDDKALSYYNDVSASSMQIGFESWVRVRNVTGVTITNGSVVVINGASGQTPTIALADADTHTPAQVIGIVTADILNNAVGHVTTHGIVKNLDTSTFLDGDVLYLSQTAGALTKVAPTAPASIVAVGIVAHAHATQGKVYVNVDDAKNYEPTITTLANTKGGTGQNSSTWTGIPKVTSGTWSVATAGVDYSVPSGTETYTNKTITQPTLTLKQSAAPTPTAEGDIQWDTDGDFIVVGDGSTTQSFASIAGTATFTNKTISLTNNTITGTLAQFNTALSDADFASIAGSETLTNKTLTSPTINNGSANLGSGTLVVPLATAPAQTANGSVVWDSNDFLLTVGDGTSRKTMVDIDSAQTLSNKTFVAPALGTPASGVATNLTGTAAGLTAGTVTTNANLTGHVTSVGNAAVLGSFTIAQLNTAVSDADVATLAGSESLTNKTIGMGGALDCNNNVIQEIKTATFNSQTTIVTASGAITVDWTSAQNQKQTEPTGSITYTFTAPPGPCHLQLIIDSDGTSTAQTITWPGTVIWIGATWAGTNNKKGIINFWYDGTNYFAQGANQV